MPLMIHSNLVSLSVSLTLHQLSVVTARVSAIHRYDLKPLGALFDFIRTSKNVVLKCCMLPSPRASHNIKTKDVIHKFVFWYKTFFPVVSVSEWQDGFDLKSNWLKFKSNCDWNFKNQVLLLQFRCSLVAWTKSNFSLIHPPPQGERLIILCL